MYTATYIVNLLTSFADLSLTMGNVAGVLNMMKRNWNYLNKFRPLGLAVYLGVPHSKRHEIRQVQQNQSREQDTAAFAEYITSHLPGFSWAILAGALYYCEEEAALQAARRYIKMEEGKLYICCFGVHYQWLSVSIVE